jgi:hypothetical protein
VSNTEVIYLFFIIQFKLLDDQLIGVNVSFIYYSKVNNLYMGVFYLIITISFSNKDEVFLKKNVTAILFKLS